MKYLLFASLLAMLAFTGTSCFSEKMWTGPPNRLNVSLADPLGTGPDAPLLVGGQGLVFTVQVDGNYAPFELAWNFGGAAPNTYSSLSQPGSSTVTVVADRITGEQGYTASVTVTDAAGVTSTDSVSFQLLGWENSPPVMEEASYSAEGITALASDADGDNLEYRLHSLLTGKDLGPPTSTGVDGVYWDLQSLVFNPNDILAGSSGFGRFEVVVTDSYGASSRSGELGSNWELYPLADDTLYAFASRRNVKVGEPVRIVVATGRTSNPFKYMDLVTITTTGKVQYVVDSFDLGDPDPYPDLMWPGPVDGVWGDMGTKDFYRWPPTVFDWATEYKDGHSEMGFSIITNDAQEIIARGILFSFEFIFWEAGTHQLGFKPYQGNLIEGTYYGGKAIPGGFPLVYSWDDISNEHPLNQVVVTQ